MKEIDDKQLTQKLEQTLNTMSVSKRKRWFFMLIVGLSAIILVRLVMLLVALSSASVKTEVSQESVPDKEKTYTMEEVMNMDLSVPSKERPDSVETLLREILNETNQNLP